MSSSAIAAQSTAENEYAFSGNSVPGNLDNEFTTIMSKKRFTQLAIGHSVNQGLIFFFDYLLYPFAIAKLGLWRGGALMSLISLIVCLGMFRLYDQSKIDWLGIEMIKDIKQYNGKNRFARFLAGLLRKGDVLACLVLSIKYDPFITTLYMRRGAFDGLKKRDWGIFLFSWLISNIWWAILCYAGVETVAGLYRWIIRTFYL